MKRSRLEFYYTDLEWTLAETNAKKSGSKSLPHYLTKKISELNNCKECCSPEKLEERIKSRRRKYYPTNTSWEILEILADQLGISPGIIVARLLINPLIKKED